MNKNLLFIPLTILLILNLFAANTFAKSSDVIDFIKKMRNTPVIIRIEKLHYGDPELYRIFFARLQNAVLNDQKGLVASFIKYPLKVYLDNNDVVIESKEEFIKNYSLIINDHVYQVLKNQEFNDLFVNYQGVMIGSGEIWFTGICQNDKREVLELGFCRKTIVKVIMINNKFPW